MYNDVFKISDYMSVQGFWTQLKKPILILAPMEDVTDNAFRQIITKYGKPDVTFTEFTSADGLISEGQNRVIHRLTYTQNQRPIVAQIFTKRPEKMLEAAKLCRQLGFDGIDLNMGCPDKNVCKHGAGAAMIKTPELAKEVIEAAREGAPDLPISVKTRLGYSNKNDMDLWIGMLLSLNLPALTIHGRTKKEMSKVPADWDSIKKVVEMRNNLGVSTLIIGNGDIKNLEQAFDAHYNYGVDGVMIGRGIFGNPWVFNKKIKKTDLSEKEILQVMLEHSRLFEELFGDEKNFFVMRKHFKSYISGFENAKDLRISLMESSDSSDVERMIIKYLEGKIS